MSIKSESYQAYIGTSRAVAEGRNAVTHSAGCFQRFLRTTALGNPGNAHQELTIRADQVMGHARNVSNHYDCFFQPALEGRPIDERITAALRVSIAMMLEAARSLTERLAELGPEPFGKAVYDVLTEHASTLAACARSHGAQAAFYCNNKRPLADAS